MPPAPSFAPWTHPLTKRGKLGSPLVEVTPFVFRDQLYRLENWQMQWEHPGSTDGFACQEDRVRIRDLATDEIVATPLIGHGLAMAFVWADRVHVFAGNWGAGAKWNIEEIVLTTSIDLVHWTPPEVVLRAAPNEKFFNVGVCRGPEQFVLLVETNDPAWPPPFTFKYFTSPDLRTWTPVPDGLYGRAKYVGGPALYYEGDWHYTLYLEALDGPRYETRITRSRDLVHWEDAPLDRPFLTFDATQPVHPLRSATIRESNASDAELCFWHGKTIVYFSGGDQQVCGDLQWAEFDGAPRQLFEAFFAEPDLPRPSPAQLAYQTRQFGCFVHFGPASCNGSSDMFVVTPAADFNPVAFDADQWARAARNAGARHIVLTAKHHNGFCLWPTSTTDYSIKNSPWRRGRGDMVGEFVAAARRHGLAPGLYLSGGDQHFPCTSTPDPMGERRIIGDRSAYTPIFREQLRELLTGYGELAVLWLDGAFDPFGWDIADAAGQPLGTGPGDEFVTLIRQHQPSAVIFGGTRSDIRWAGNEDGRADYPLWNVIAPGDGPKNWLSLASHGWLPAEADAPTRRTWFWTPNSDDQLRPPAELVTMYEESVGRGANLLINLAPDASGLISAAEVRNLEAFSREIQSRYGRALGTVTSRDGWSEAHCLELVWPAPVVVTGLSLQEEIAYGQRIHAYVVEAWLDHRWQSIAVGSSIGRRRLHHFASVTTPRVRLRLTDFIPLPRISLTCY